TEQAFPVPDDLLALSRNEVFATQTTIFVAEAGRVIGMIAVRDPIRQGAEAAVALLRADGLTVIMATGDAEGPAEAVASTLDVGRIETGLSPEGKHDLVEKLKAAGRRVAMAGDGVNDAPALAAADVGIAMGGGADVALQQAGLTLLSGELSA